MRVAFLGTAEFSVPSLLALHAAGHDVAVVVTQPDRAGDRGRPAPRPVADAARDLRLTVWQPRRIRDDEAVDELLRYRPDALVVAAYGQILPARLLDAPPHGGINVHASLLPRWRGAAPVAAAILAGDTRTGVSIMRMEAGLDTGPVYATREIAIGADATTPRLTAELARLGAGLLVDVLGAVERGTAEAVPQDDAAATHAPRLTREDGHIDWGQLSAVEVDRRVRALQPWPGTVAPLGGAEVRILSGWPLNGTESSAASPVTAAPGTVVGTGRTEVDVATRAGVFRVMTVQPPGRRAMDAAAYLRGRRG